MTKTRIKFTWKFQDNTDLEEFIDAFEDKMRLFYLEAVESIVKLKHLQGRVLEIGSGYGHLAMTLCSRAEFPSIVGLEQSKVMIKTAEIITARHSLNERITYRLWDGETLPFGENEFDAVVSFLSLHRWPNPEKTFAEIERVRKSNSIAFISDFRRNQSTLAFHWFNIQNRLGNGKSVADILSDSLKASYTPAEIDELAGKSGLSNYKVDESGMWLRLSCAEKIAIVQSA